MTGIECTPEQAARFEELRQQAQADVSNHASKSIRVTESRINQALELYAKYGSKRMVCRDLNMGRKTVNTILEQMGVPA